MEKLYDFSHFLMHIWPFNVIPIIKKQTYHLHVQSRQ